MNTQFNSISTSFAHFVAPFTAACHLLEFLYLPDVFHVADGWMALHQFIIVIFFIFSNLEYELSGTELLPGQTFQTFLLLH